MRKVTPMQDCLRLSKIKACIKVAAGTSNTYMTTRYWEILNKEKENELAQTAKSTDELVVQFSAC